MEQRKLQNIIYIDYILVLLGLSCSVTI